MVNVIEFIGERVLFLKLVIIVDRLFFMFSFIVFFNFEGILVILVFLFLYLYFRDLFK